MEDRDPTAGPDGGGALAARAVELAALLVAGAARRARAEWDGAGGAVAQAQALARRAVRLGDANQAAYRAATAALDGDLRSERPATRDQLLGDALQRAAETPLQLADAAADAAALAVHVARHAPGPAAADAISAAQVAAGAARAAAHLVTVNLATRDGDERVLLARRAVARAADGLPLDGAGG